MLCVCNVLRSARVRSRCEHLRDDGNWVRSQRHCVRRSERLLQRELPSVWDVRHRVRSEHVGVLGQRRLLLGELRERRLRGRDGFDVHDDREPLRRRCGVLLEELRWGVSSDGRRLRGLQRHLLRRRRLLQCALHRERHRHRGHLRQPRRERDGQLRDGRRAVRGLRELLQPYLCVDGDRREHLPSRERLRARERALSERRRLLWRRAVGGGHADVQPCERGRRIRPMRPHGEHP